MASLFWIRAQYLCFPVWAILSEQDKEWSWSPGPQDEVQLGTQRWCGLEMALRIRQLTDSRYWMSFQQTLPVCRHEKKEYTIDFHIYYTKQNNRSYKFLIMNTRKLEQNVVIFAKRIPKPISSVET